MRKPASLTFDQAAAVPDYAVTALQGLRDAGKVKPGQKVLIIGAAGGVGTFAVQIAKAFGAEVTGVCSTTKTDLCSLFSMERPKEDLQFLKELVEAGKVTPFIDRTYPLSEVPEAIRYQAPGIKSALLTRWSR